MATKKTVGDFYEHLTSFKPEYPVKKGYVAQLLCEGNSVASVCKRVKEIVEAHEHNRCLNEGALRPGVSRFEGVLKTYKSNLTNHWFTILQILLEPFHVPFKKFTTSLPLSQPPVLEPIASACTSSFPEPPVKKLKRDCESCVEKVRTQMNLAKSVSTLKEKLRLQNKLHKEELARLSKVNHTEIIRKRTESMNQWKTKYMNAKMKNINVLILKSALDASKKEVRDQKVEIMQYKFMLQGLQKKLEIARNEIEDFKKYYLDVQVRKSVEEKEMKKEHRKQISAARKEQHYLESQLEALREAVDEKACCSLEVEVKDNKKTYGCKVRKCLYKCLTCQVNVSRCGELIDYIGRYLFGKVVPKLPVKSVISTMSYELGVLSNIKLGYVLHRVEEVATIAWDATTLRGSHINQVHIETESEILVVSIAVLAGGTGSDYFQHICDALLGAVRIYTDAFHLVENDVQKVVFSKIKSCITDRAKVNHCTVQKLQEELNLDIMELHCLVHPLDGLARAARSDMKTLDIEWNLQHLLRKSSSECVAVDLLYNISKMRYKQEIGDPAGFRQFLKSKKLKQRLIMRYVGNRMNVLFSMAATVYIHRNVLLEYLNGCVRNQLKDIIIKQLENKHVLLQLQALGLFGKLLSGPWMDIFYGNVEKKSHLEVASEYFPKCIDSLDKIRMQPDYILHCTENMFGKDLILCEDIRNLRVVSFADIFRVIVVMLAGSFHRVLSLQLEQYLNGDLSVPSAEMLADTASAPLNNMQAERSLGMVDALWRKAPVARSGFIDGKVRGSLNKVLDWLETFPVSEQERLVNFARKRGKQLEKFGAVNVKNIEQELSIRRKDRRQRANMTKKKELERILTSSISQHRPLQELEMFQHLDENNRCVLEKITSDPIALIGFTFTYLLNKKGVDIEYNVRITGIKPLKGKAGNGIGEQQFCLTSWEPEDPDSDSDFNMPVIKFLAHLSVGDIQVILS